MPVLVSKTFRSGRIVRRKQARFIGQDGDRRPPLWRLTFGTSRPVVNRTPDGQGACCRSHENPHQHVIGTTYSTTDFDFVVKGGFSWMELFPGR